MSWEHIYVFEGQSDWEKYGRPPQLKFFGKKEKQIGKQGMSLYIDAVCGV